jgi:hypothetical protein
MTKGVEKLRRWRVEQAPTRQASAIIHASRPVPTLSVRGAPAASSGAQTRSHDGHQLIDDTPVWEVLLVQVGTFESSALT